VNGEGDGRDDLWQGYVFGGSAPAKCETCQRHGSDGEVDVATSTEAFSELRRVWIC